MMKYAADHLLFKLFDLIWLNLNLLEFFFT